MDLREAYDELGVADGAPADQVRRAYLRLLKTRKPEIDPEGFQRLRAAFEAVGIAAVMRARGPRRRCRRRRT